MERRNDDVVFDGVESTYVCVREERKIKTTILPLGSIGPLIVPDLADLLAGCLLDLKERKSSTEPACNAGHTHEQTHAQYTQ